MTLGGTVFTVFMLMQFTGIAAQGQVALPDGPCQVKAHPTWSVVEKWTWGRLCIGQIADLGVRDERSLDPRSTVGWDDERLLGPGFLESVLLHEPWTSALPRQGVRINGALFDAPVELADGRIEHPLQLSNSRFTKRVDFQRIETRSYMSLVRSHFQGQLNLNSAAISGELDMTDTRVSGRLDMVMTNIGAGLFMRRNAEFTDVNLRGARIGGHLNMIGASVSGTLWMNSASINGPLHMSGDAVFNNINLRGAQVDNQLDMTGATVSGTLLMNAATIGGNLHMSEARFGNPITGVFVQTGGNLELAGAELAGLDLTGAHIGGELLLAVPDSQPGWRDGARLILHNTAVDAIQDTPAPGDWPLELELHGFVYRMLGGMGGDINITDRGAQSYAQWLARDKPYTPQPYEQLAGVLKRMGHGKEANDVLYAGRERARDLVLEDKQHVVWVGQTALKYTIGYGLGSRYFRSFYWVLALVLTGTLLLRLSGQNRIVDEKGKPPLQLAFFYSLDILLPIIRLRSRHYNIDLQGFVRYYFYFHQVMGYVLASFLVAGLSGITK